CLAKRRARMLVLGTRGRRLSGRGWLGKGLRGRPWRLRKPAKRPRRLREPARGLRKRLRRLRRRARRPRKRVWALGNRHREHTRLLVFQRGRGSVESWRPLRSVSTRLSLRELPRRGERRSLDLRGWGSKEPSTRTLLRILV